MNKLVLGGGHTGLSVAMVLQAIEMNPSLSSATIPTPIYNKQFTPIHAKSKRGKFKRSGK